MPYRVDARLSGRHPFELYMLTLGFVSGLPALLGTAPDPGSIDASMPPWVAFLWSLTLVGGCGVALVGIYWRNRVTGLILEQLGLACAGVAAVVYAGAILYAIGFSALLSIGIVSGFGFSCIRRWRQLQQVIDDVHALETPQDES